MKDTTFDLKLVMTYAVAAFKQNQEEYINYPGPDSVTNKTLILSHLGVLSEHQTAFVDTVTQDCETTAEDIIKYYRGLTFKAMGNKINDFEQKVLNLIQTGVVDRRDIGVVASLPKAYKRAVKRDAKDIEMRKLSTISEYIGKEGEKICGAVEIINCSFIQRLACYIVNAKMGTDIVCFFTKHGAEQWGDACTVEGKVKRHQLSKFHGGKETVLNYVKVVDKT